MYHMANAVVQRIHCIVIYSSFQNGSYKGLEKRDSIVITSRNYQRKDGIIEEQQKHNQFLALTLLSVVRQQFSIVLLQHSLDSWWAVKNNGSEIYIFFYFTHSCSFWKPWAYISNNATQPLTAQSKVLVCYANSGLETLTLKERWGVSSHILFHFFKACNLQPQCTLPQVISLVKAAECPFE